MSVPASNAQPLNEQQASSVQTALSGLSDSQLMWVSGYAAGLASASEPVAEAAAGETFTILYGSQTGNGEAIAMRLAEQARARGFAVAIMSLADFKPANLRKETLTSFIISTHGEGDPPDDAELFHEFLLSAKAPKLEQLRFNVLALGDSSYINFCQTGREFDRRLEELGASRLAPIVECDVDYDGDAEAWTSDTLARLPELLDAGPSVPRLRAVSTAPVYDRKNPFPAEVLVSQRITGRDSSKDVHHLELSLEGSGITYEPGDSIAVLPLNPPSLVTELLDATGIGGTSIVRVDGEDIAIEDALADRLEITLLNLNFLRAWVDLSGSSALAAVLEDEAQFAALIESHQVIDIVRGYPASATAQALADSLRKLAPRSYSIASSLAANPDEVHLTVAAVRYQAFGSDHWGAASTYLADRVEEGGEVRVFVEPNKRFRLPTDPRAPVIMIGPGTGVAPFRAFVEERAERGAEGPNWLIFGERNFGSDFLYQLEWQRHLKSGALTRLDVAFSRDQAEKIYVQDRIREHGAEIKRWIDDGAFVYVCGDARHMAPDVDAALRDVIAEHGGLDAAQAEDALKSLRRAGRYLRDVY